MAVRACTKRIYLNLHKSDYITVCLPALVQFRFVLFPHVNWASLCSGPWHMSSNMLVHGLQLQRDLCFMSQAQSSFPMFPIRVSTSF